MTMLDLARMSNPILALPRKTRDQVEQLLREKREKEDESKTSDPSVLA